MTHAELLRRDAELAMREGGMYYSGEYLSRMASVAESLEAENAKLREERNHWHVEQVHAYGNWEDTYKRAVELESENAKLRELLSSYWKRVHSPVASNVERDYLAEMRELGVEVDK